jgi:hypothetical protein
MVAKRLTRRANLKQITLGILAWKSPKTLANTLESYRKNGLLKMVHPVIYFQERTPELDKIARSYGVRDIIGTPENVGILRAFMYLIEHAKTKYFMFAECDFELVNPRPRTETILRECMRLMSEKGVDLVRLRDRANPGTPIGSRTWIQVPDEKLEDHPMDNGFPHKIESLYYFKEPEKKFPGVFEIIDYKHKWYKCSSDHSWWSNHVFIATVSFLKEKVIPVLHTRPGVGPDGKNDSLFEKMENFLIQNLKGYTVAGGPGLFKHNRLDR